MFQRRFRAKVAIGALAMGIALAGCGPVKMGAAATIGDQRITTEQLNKATSEWREAFEKVPSQTRTQMETQMQESMFDFDAPQRSVLEQLVSMRLIERTAAENGLSTSPGEVDRLIERVGGSRQFDLISVANAVPPSQGRRLAASALLRRRLMTMAAPGRSPQQAQSELATMLIRTAHTLKIRIDPRYGAYNPAQLALSPVRYTLSKPESGTR